MGSQESWGEGLARLDLSHILRGGWPFFSDAMGRKGEETLMDTEKLEHDNVLVPHGLRFYEVSENQTHFYPKYRKGTQKATFD